MVGPPPVRWGASLRDEVRHAIWGCDVVCVVIGTDWTTSTNGTGRRRLMLVRDPVRVEVETALRAGIVAVPAAGPIVLVISGGNAARSGIASVTA